MDIDDLFRCQTKGCTNFISTTTTFYCSSCLRNENKVALTCIGCNEPFDKFPAKSHRVRRYCPDCEELIKKYDGRLRDSGHIHIYGLNKIDLIKMLVAQNNSCLVCGDTIEGRYSIDHSHSCTHVTTKRHVSCKACVRGLLCQGCNSLVGFVETKGHLLENVMKYLGRQEVSV